MHLKLDGLMELKGWRARTKPQLCCCPRMKEVLLSFQQEHSGGLSTPTKLLPSA